MKKLHLFKTMLLLCALIVGSSSVWAEEVTIASFTASTYNAGTTGGWTMTNNPSYATSGGGYYQLIASESSIVTPSIKWSGYSDITITISARKYGGPNATQGKISVSQGSTELTSYSPSGTSIVASSALKISPTGTGTLSIACLGASSSKGCGVQSIVIKGTPKVAHLASIALSGTYQTVFHQGDTFNHDGMTVTATYEDEDTKDVTGDATFTGYDMSSIGEQTVTVSYTENEVTKTTTYDITVNAPANLTGIVLSGSYQTEFTKGDAFTNDGIVVTANYDDETSKIVTGSTTFTGYNMSSIGVQAVTASYTENEVTKTANYNIIVRTDANLSFDEASYTCDKFASFVAPTLNTADGFDGTVTYGSSNTGVATVNASTGVITINGTGETTITASSAQTNKFFAGEASYTLTVTIHSGVEPIDPLSAHYAKVTETSGITDGNYLIVYETGGVAFNGARATLDAESNTIDVVITDGAIPSNDETDAAAFSYNVTAKTLTNQSGVLIGNDSWANALDEGDSGLTNEIEIDGSGNAVISAIESKSGTSYTTMRYNSASNQNRFRYYKSGQQAIQLYKYEATPGSVTLSSDGYKTMVASKAFSTKNATIYIVTESDTEVASLTRINKAPANTPIILKGSPNQVVALDVEDSGSDVSGNLLEISDEDTGNGVYVLANRSGEVGFFKWNGGSLGTGRVYLPAPDGGAREFIAFSFDDGETTSLREIRNEELEIKNAEFFNLNGQRVAQPTKGLYIVNGKKVIVK